jgi:hypothetical protein
MFQAPQVSPSSASSEYDDEIDTNGNLDDQGIYHYFRAAGLSMFTLMLTCMSTGNEDLVLSTSRSGQTCLRRGVTNFAPNLLERNV